MSRTPRHDGTYRGRHHIQESVLDGPMAKYGILDHVLNIDPKQSTKELGCQRLEIHFSRREEGKPHQHTIWRSYRKALVAIGEIDSIDSYAPLSASG